MSNSFTLESGAKLAHDRYEIDRVLGQGGFGITYRARDSQLDRWVAIKEFFMAGCVRQGGTVQPSPSLRDQFTSRKDRFRDEARALAQFRHRGIVQVHEFFEQNDTVYMVMENLEGRSLGEVLRAAGGKLDEASAVAHGCAIADALGAVHEAGLLHRDVKPDNVLILDDGNVVLIDFGTAREFISGGPSEMSMTLSPGYAPPEQYSPRGDFGPSTDIYALGATLYECCTGQMPTGSFERSVGHSLTSPSVHNPTLSPHVVSALEWAMQMEAGDRPQHTSEFVAALRGEIRPPVAAAPAAPTQPLAPPPAPPAPPAPVSPPAPVAPAAPPASLTPAGPPPPAPPTAGAPQPLQGPLGPPSTPAGSNPRLLYGIIAAGVVILIIGIIVLVTRSGDDVADDPEPAPTATVPPTPEPPPTPIPPTPRPTPGIPTPVATAPGANGSSASGFAAGQVALDVIDRAGLPRAAAPYADFQQVSDDDNLIRVRVPSDWSEIDGTEWVFDGNSIGPSLTVAPDLAAIQNDISVPGLFIGASDQHPVTTTGELLDIDLEFFSGLCDYDGRREYEDAAYVGFVDIFLDCGPAGSVLLQVAAIPESGDFIILAQLVATDHRDWAAIGEIIDTFVADLPA